MRRASLPEGAKSNSRSISVNKSHEHLEAPLDSALAAAQRHLERAQARAEATEQLVVTIAEQQRLHTAQGRGIGCQRQNWETKSRALEDRRQAAEESRRTALAELERAKLRDQSLREQLEAGTASPWPSAVFRPSRPAGSSPGARAKLLRARSRPGETFPLAVSPPRPSAPAALRNSPRSRAPSPLRQQSSGAKPSAAPSPAASRAHSPLRRSQGGSASASALLVAARTQSPVRQTSAKVAAPPRTVVSKTAKSGAASPAVGKSGAASPAVGAPAVAPPAVGPAKKESEMQAKLVGMNEAELRRVLTALPRKQLEGALATAAVVSAAGVA